MESLLHTSLASCERSEGLLVLTPAALVQPLVVYERQLVSRSTEIINGHHTAEPHLLVRVSAWRHSRNSCSALSCANPGSCHGTALARHGGPASRPLRRIHSADTYGRISGFGRVPPVLRRTRCSSLAFTHHGEGYRRLITPSTRAESCHRFPWVRS